eukprot:TRINITY_DN23613_c0_g1_i2.p1 TRINITY_DN23613_c0_g1~~TRINITY_DN23613_c0_g1_i2.p1  ORF type:complete len:1812 (-),score=336.46 TRINITY_DN23613_c0_g1_i2:299-5206(-)
MAVVPGRQVIVHLTLLPHVLDWVTAATIKAINATEIGTRLDGEVLDTLPKYGVRLRCALPSSSAGSRVLCFCPSNRNADKDAGDRAGEEALRELKAGTSTKCRVLGRDLLAGALIVTRRPYDLQDDTLVSVTELEPGQLISGEIVRVTDFGVFVKLSEYIQGLVHLRQLTDVPLASVSKKHQVGTKLKCRVLKVIPEKRQVALTAKKSLVKDKFQLVRFDQARKDMIVTGYVATIKDFGAIVSFYGDAHGLIPKEEMELDEAPAVGMSVRCRIASLNRKRQRIGLSVDMDGGKEPQEFEDADGEGGSAFTAMPGNLVEDVVAERSLPEGVLVKFTTKQGSTNDAPAALGFIPTPHLSDNLDQAKTRHAAVSAALSAGTLDAEVLKLGQGVVLAKRFHPKREAGGEAPEGDVPWATLLSVKPTLYLSAQEAAFPTELGQVQESRLYTGYVKDVMDFGVVVSIGAFKVAGVAPKHQLAERFLERPSDEFVKGQTVRALVSRVEADKKRFAVDLRPAVVTAADSPLLRREAEALRLYFQLRATLSSDEPSEPWQSLRPGVVLDATVKTEKPYGVLLSLNKYPDLTALALTENMPSPLPNLQPGTKLKCAVLDFDTQSKIVDVSLQAALVDANSNELLGAQTSKQKKKKSNAAELGDGTGAKVELMEVNALPALQKPAYTVLWVQEPPGIVFVPPWTKQRWAKPLPTFMHCIPVRQGVYDRCIARCPVGATSGKSKKSAKAGVPKILRPAEELTIGSPVTMRVQAVRGLQVLCAAPVDIRGHVHATQLVDASSTTQGLRALEGISKGKTLEARVLQMQQHGEGSRGKVWHLELTCRPSLMQAKDASDYEAAVVKWPALKPGRQVQAAICEIRKNIIWVELSPNIRGQVQLLDATTDLSALKAPADHFQVGQVFSATVLRSVRAQKQLDLSFVSGYEGPAKLGKTLAKLVKIEDARGRGVAASFRLPGRRRGFVHITELFDFWAQFPLRRLKQGSFYEVTVLQGDADADPDEGEATAEGARAELSLRPSLVHGTAASAEEKRPVQISDVKVGQKLSGYVVNANDKGVFVALSRTLVGRIKLRALSDQVVLKDSVSQLHPIGSLLRDMNVVEVDAENKRIELSLRKGNQEGRLTADQLSVGDVVSGRVKMVQNYGLFLHLDNSSVDALVHKSEVSDSPSVSLDSFKAGMPVPRAKVLKVEGGKVWCGIKPSLFEDDGDLSDDDDLDLDMSADEGGDDEDDDDAAGEGDADVEDASKSRKRAAEEVAPAQKKAQPAADSDDEVPWAHSAAGAGVAPSADAAFRFAEFKVEDGGSGSEDEGVSDADGDGDDNDGAGRPTKRQKKAQKAKEEKEIQKREVENADGEWAKDPRSVEDFERLLLTQGDTSIVWIRYMAFHLKMSDLEKARQVAERAVKHVGFSEAKERFNVWVAYMNMECTFGTDQTAEALFKRAASHNDAKKTHMQLARIHERNKKPDLATKVYDICCRKFPQSKKVWLAFLTFLYDRGDLEGGRKTLPKCLAALPRRKHPVVVSKAALLEYHKGSKERGRSIFEGLLDSYPKRTDLWSVYLDAHIGAYTPPKAAKADLAEIRGLMERCCTMRLKAAKMRFFFKRWLDFEKKWGDAESQELVRTKAREFVESQGS